MQHILLSSKHWLPFSKPIAKALGSADASIFLSEICNLITYHEPPDGWVFATYESIEAETTLSRRSQERAVEALIDVGLIETRKRGMPARRYFRLAPDFNNKLNALFVRCDKQVCKISQTSLSDVANKFVRCDDDNKNITNNNRITKTEVVESEEVKPPSLPPHRVVANPLPEFSASSTAEKINVISKQAREFYKTLLADQMQIELLRKNNHVGNKPLTMEQLIHYLQRFCKYRVEIEQKGWHSYDDFRKHFYFSLPTSIARAKEEGGARWVRPETATFKRPAN